MAPRKIAHNLEIESTGGHRGQNTRADPFEDPQGPRERQRRCRAADSDPPAFERGIPDCPAWLSPGAKEVWETYAPMLDDVAAIKVADGLVFAALCETAASYSAAVQGVWQQGEVLFNPKTGCAHKNPLVGVAEAARRDLLRLAAQFGLTPVSEVGLATPAVPEPDDDDPFA